LTTLRRRWGKHTDSFLTPAERFYVRRHSPAPKIEVASYRLRIDGAVRSPFSLTYKDLRDLPSETRVATLECAGNSRDHPSESIRTSHPTRSNRRNPLRKGEFATGSRANGA
jgi:hypothetical protein